MKKKNYPSQGILKTATPPSPASVSSLLLFRQKRKEERKRKEGREGGRKLCAMSHVFLLFSSEFLICKKYWKPF